MIVAVVVGNGDGAFVRYVLSCAEISVVTYIIQWQLASFEIARISTLFTFSHGSAV